MQQIVLRERSLVLVDEERVLIHTHALGLYVLYREPQTIGQQLDMCSQTQQCGEAP